MDISKIRLNKAFKSGINMPIGFEPGTVTLLKKTSDSAFIRFVDEAKQKFEFWISVDDGRTNELVELAPKQSSVSVFLKRMFWINAIVIKNLYINIDFLGWNYDIEPGNFDRTGRA